MNAELMSPVIYKVRELAPEGSVIRVSFTVGDQWQTPYWSAAAMQPDTFEDYFHVVTEGDSLEELYAAIAKKMASLKTDSAEKIAKLRAQADRLEALANPVKLDEVKA